jgi:hypothetical protein
LIKGASAFTSANFSGYQWDVDVVGDDYLVSGLRISVKPIHAVMWAVTTARSSDLLKHEQGHYDITGLVVRDFARNVLSLSINIDVVGRMKEAGSTAASRHNWVVHLFQSAIKGYERERDAVLGILQSTYGEGVYDFQTKHGTDLSAQSRWSSRLQRYMTQNTSFGWGLKAEGVIKQLSQSD